MLRVMRELSIDDILPERASFFLKDKKKEYFLRPINLTDNVWLKNKWGDKVDKIFDPPDMPELSKIVYRLLEDKSDFRAEDIEYIDDEGETQEKRITGPEKLCESIQGVTEQINIFRALMSTIGISQPVFNEMLEEELSKTDKKKINLSRVGAKSLTRSRRSTATRSSRSVK